MNDTIIVNDVDLFVTGEIGLDFTADYFMQTLNAIPSGETANVHIFSGGGSVFEALAVYDFVKLKGIKFNAYISGLSGSAATIIGACAENTFIGANSFYMVHRAYSNGGESPEVQNTLDAINERIIKIYQDLTGLSKPRVKQLLDAGDKGAFLKSKDAVQLGFVNSEFKEAQLAASIDWYNEVVNKSNINMSTIKEELEAFKNEVVTDITNIFKANKQEVSEDELNSKVDEAIKAKSEALELKQSELISNKVTEFEAKVNELNEKFDAEKLELQNSIEAKDKEINELKGTETKVEVVATVEDPTGEPAEKTEGELILAKIASSFTAIDKLNASVK